MAFYADRNGRRRQIVLCQGAAGSRLLIDRDVETLGDCMLVAHLASDEPAVNAEIVCDLYLDDPLGRWCRPVCAEDLQAAPVGELEALARGVEVPVDPDCLQEGADPDAPERLSQLCAGDCAVPEEAVLVAANGDRFALRPCAGGMTIPELRWARIRLTGRDVTAPGEREAATVSVRDVVGALESYEPARTITAKAVCDHADDDTLSVSVLRIELGRLNSSRIVLNRRLREAVVGAVCAGAVTMSDIAIRCDRVKRDRRGGNSGETTWLGRRLGLVPEDGAPTPWIHSEVLALVARSGLGMSPREVELG